MCEIKRRIEGVEFWFDVEIGNKRRVSVLFNFLRCFLIEFVLFWIGWINVKNYEVILCKILWYDVMVSCVMDV